MSSHGQNKLNSNKIKSKTFDDTPNIGGGCPLSGLDHTRVISVKSLSADIFVVDLGNGYILVIDNKLNVVTNRKIKWVAYYI